MNYWAAVSRLIASLVDYIVSAPSGEIALERAERALKAAASEQASEAAIKKALG